MCAYRDTQGHFQIISRTGETVRAFMPVPLPPKPPIRWTPPLLKKFDRAMLELGRLDTVSTLLPDASLFLYTYVRKEAVLSSMIEGTQSSLSDLLLFEMDQAPGVPLDDTKEVSNYVAALSHGLKLLNDGLPLSSRLLCEIHRVLLSTGRGSKNMPGEIRTSQNWVGGTRPGNAIYVPPPAECVPECMSHLEYFLHDQPQPTQVLLKAALAHVQFESIHPFLDGNGRLGRLLITLILCEQNILHEPILYLSLYFKTHRKMYYDLLTTVRMKGDWEAWLEFFADAVIDTAGQAVETAKQLLALAERDGGKIQVLGRAALSTLRIHQELVKRPICTPGFLVGKTGLTAATVNRALAHLKRLDIVTELTQKKRNRVFSYAGYMTILNRGTEQPAE